MYQTYALQFMVASSKEAKVGIAPLLMSIIVNKKRVCIMKIQTDLFAQEIALSAQRVKDCFNGIQINKQWGLLELYHNLELSKMVV